jgi:hypothetical protein
MLIRTSQQEWTSVFAVFSIETIHFVAFVCQRRVTEDCLGRGQRGVNCSSKYNVYICNIYNIHIYTPYLFFTTLYWYSLKLLTETFIFKQNSLWKGIWKILFSVHRACIYIIWVTKWRFLCRKILKIPPFCFKFSILFLGRPTTPSSLWAGDTPTPPLPHSSFWESQVYPSG